MMMMSRYRQVALVGGASAVITHTSATNSEPQHQKMQLVFLGTGSSIGCPRPVCATKDPLKDAPAWSSVCRNSWKALVGDPRHNSNYRNNPSLLVRVPTPTGVDGYTNIVIDAGKTFREAVIRWFPHQNPPVAGVDAVILTHEHADAMLGLDDVRGAQDPRPGVAIAPMPIFLSRKCLDRCAEAFPYLMPSVEKPTVERFVAKLDFNIVYDDAGCSSSSSSSGGGGGKVTCCEEQEGGKATKEKIEGAVAVAVSASPFTQTKTKPLDHHSFTVGAKRSGGDSAGKKRSAGVLDVKVLPVVHGEDCTCLGFAFGSPGNRVVYLSDLSRVPPDTMRALQEESEQGIEVLVLDCLKESPHNTHLSLPESLNLIRALRPKRALLVGMGCDSFPSHDEMNRRLKEWGRELLLNRQANTSSSTSSTFTPTAMASTAAVAAASVAQVRELEVMTEALSASTRVEFARDGLVVEVDFQN